MVRDSQCVFCKIVAADLPAFVVYEDSSVVSFLDINPLAEGHLILIPRPHYPRLTDIPIEECGALFSPVPMLGRCLMEVTGAEGFNVLVNQGSVAGQVVGHVHCHLIPRKPMDELGYRWNASSYPEGRAAVLAAAYQAAIAHH